MSWLFPRTHYLIGIHFRIKPILEEIGIFLQMRSQFQLREVPYNTLRRHTGNKPSLVFFHAHKATSTAVTPPVSESGEGFQ